MKQLRIPLVVAALVVCGGAFAQTPIQRQADQYEPTQRGYVKPMEYRQQAGVPLAHPLPNGTTRDPAGMLQRDRFGNVVRGDRCADNPANCAYDPSK